MMQNLGRDGGGEGLLDGRLLTPRQVADLLQVDMETLRRWARQGTGPPFIPVAPATKRYPETLLTTWMRQHLQLQQEDRAS